MRRDSFTSINLRIKIVRERKGKERKEKWSRLGMQSIGKVGRFKLYELSRFA